MIDPLIPADSIYQASRWLAMAGWLLLLLSLFVPKTRRLAWPATQFLIPAIFCAAYVFMVWQGRGGFQPDGVRTFFSLPGIYHLYGDSSALTASWLHFLALDLFAGTWIVRDGLDRGCRSR